MGSQVFRHAQERVAVGNPSGLNGPETAGAVGSAVAAIYAAFIYPLSKKAREARRVRQSMLLWFTGAKAITGITPELIPAPVQLSQLQEDVHKVLSRLDEVLAHLSTDAD